MADRYIGPTQESMLRFAGERGGQFTLTAYLVHHYGTVSYELREAHRSALKRLADRDLAHNTAPGERDAVWRLGKRQELTAGLHVG